MVIKCGATDALTSATPNHVPVKEATMAVNYSNKARIPGYYSWFQMRTRCLNKENPAYSRYGGRGISVHPRWINSFENFISDMGERPDGMSLDRIDNNGDYSPDNCRWATPAQQARNTKKTVKLTINNETKSVSEWAIEFGASRKVVTYRLRKGWSPLTALLIPPLHPWHHRGYKKPETPASMDDGYPENDLPVDLFTRAYAT